MNNLRVRLLIIADLDEKDQYMVQYFYYFFPLILLVNNNEMIYIFSLSFINR